MDAIPEHQQLLVDLVEAYRRAGPSVRQAFIAYPSISRHNWTLNHPGISSDHSGAYPSDLELLSDTGMIRVRRLHGGAIDFEISPTGFQFYEKVKQEVGAPCTHRGVDSFLHRRRALQASPSGRVRKMETS